MKTMIAKALVVGLLCLPSVGAAQQRDILSEPESRGMMRWDAADQQKFNQIISDASGVYQKFLDKKRAELPVAKLRTERACIAVVPQFTSTALVVGVAEGQGIVSCKQKGEGSPWSAPSFFKMSNRSLGAQLGRESSEVVAYVIGDEAGSNFAKGTTFELGSEIGATAGTVGGNIGVSARSGETYVLNRQGGFLGISLSGSSITPDMDANEKYYGRKVSAQEILFENKVPVSPEARRFTDLLRQT